jgi:hypothetical protein
MAPSNEASNTADGYVKVCFDGEKLSTLKMEVSGLTPDIDDGGVHVHTGTSCDDATTQGGHYYVTWDDATPDVTLDPWLFDETPIAPTGASYYTDSSGKGKGHFDFDSGYGYDDNVGHVIIIHESKAAGYARIACGVLQPTSSSLKTSKRSKLSSSSKKTSKRSSKRTL